MPNREWTDAAGDWVGLSAQDGCSPLPPACCRWQAQNQAAFRVTLERGDLRQMKGGRGRTSHSLFPGAEHGRAEQLCPSR